MPTAAGISAAPLTPRLAVPHRRVAILIALFAAAGATALFFFAAEIGRVLGPITIGAVADVAGGFDAALWSLAGVRTALVLLARRLSRHTRSVWAPS